MPPPQTIDLPMPLGVTVNSNVIVTVLYASPSENHFYYRNISITTIFTVNYLVIIVLLFV